MSELLSPQVDVRSALENGAGKAAATALGSSAQAEELVSYRIQHGRIKQSVVPWCFKGMKVSELAQHAASMGLQSIELCPSAEWPRLRELGLTCAIASSHGFSKGFAHIEEQPECIETLRKAIDNSANFGCPSVITFPALPAA